MLASVIVTLSRLLLSPLTATTTVASSNNWSTMSSPQSSSLPSASSSSLSCSSAANPPATLLWDFTRLDNVSEWLESSDGTERRAGISTGSFKLYSTASFRRVIMFSLLVPQPNGAGFVGFRVARALDLSPYSAVVLRCRARGANRHYKVYVKQASNSATHHDGGAYEAHFHLPDEQFERVRLPLAQFHFYFRGRQQKDAPALDPAAIAVFGVQIYGGVYDDFKQSGVAALEIDWIGAD